MLTIKGFVTTTEDLAAYGGISVSEETMGNIAAAIREGSIPFHANHDERNILHPHVLTAEVRTMDTGALGVWAEFEIQEEEFSSYDNLRGFSVSIIDDYLLPNQMYNKPTMSIGADAGQFDDETLQEAVSRLQPYFTVGGGRLYQFSEIPPAKVLIDMAWTMLLSVPPGIFANAVYDGLRCFLNPKHAQESLFIYRIKGEDRTVNARLETSNEKILSQAIASLPDAILAAFKEPQVEVLEFNKRRRKWTKRP